MENDTSPNNEIAGEHGESSAQKQIQRYAPVTSFKLGSEGPEAGLAEAPDGEYVTYADHIAAIMNPSGQRLTGNDEATYKLIQLLLNTIVTAEQDPMFAGFRMEEIMNQEGLLLGVRLVACDAIGGVAAPRMV